MTARTLSLLIAAMIGTAAAGYWVGRQTPNYSHGDTAPNDTVAPAATTAPPARKVLYYRNPMGEADTSPVPKQDSMGMDYIPVYADEVADEPGTVALTPGRIQTLGVRTAVVERRALAGSVHALGRVEADERRLADIAPRFDGWIERLAVNTTGQVVKKGQTLFEVYSPELISAQREYALAAKAAAESTPESPDSRKAMQQLAEASLARLANWNVDAESAKNGVSRTLTFRSPVAGVVIEKKAVQGMRFLPGDALYQIADISAVWVIADVPEQDIALVGKGGKAGIRVDAWPGRRFDATVAYVYPTLNAQTRTVPVRLELANPGGLLKPAMYASVEMAPGGTKKMLTVPTSAVIDSGTRQIVLLQKAAGRFEPRDVKLGERSDDFVEVREGLKEGDAVVVAANFLIDAESNLKAALSGLTAAPAQGAKVSVSHQASGTLDAIDQKSGTVTVTHAPVASLSWPAMTMDFILANPALAEKQKAGAAVSIEFVERGPGEWVITKMEAKGAAPAAAHKGH